MRKVVAIVIDSNDETPPEVELEQDDEVVSAKLSHHVGPSGFRDDQRARLEVIVVRTWFLE